MDDELQTDPLFAGMTRPALLFGVPAPAFGASFFIPMMLVIITRSLLPAPLFVVIYGVLRIICAQDPRMLRYVMLALRTKGIIGNRKFWGVSSYSPSSYRKR